MTRYGRPRRLTVDGLRLVRNSGEFGVGSAGNDYKASGQLDKLVKVAHVSCRLRVSEGIRVRECWYW